MFKQVLEDKIAKINTGSSSWLEPMHDFIMSALSAHKIARKNTVSEDLVIFAKNIGLYHCPYEEIRERVK